VISSRTVGRGGLAGIASLGSRRLTVRGRRVGIPLVCSQSRPCQGVVRLSGAGPVRFRLARGSRRTIFAELAVRLSRRLAHRHSVKDTLMIVSELQAARFETRRSVTLVAGPRRP
jgi:hypothetical protein